MPNGPHNGSALVSPQMIEVDLASEPGAPALRVRVFADVRMAPNPGAALQSTMLRALAWDRAVIVALLQRVAALEILASELARDEGSDGPLPHHSGVGRYRDPMRTALVLADITARADAMSLAPPAEPASAFDGLDPAAAGGDTAAPGGGAVAGPTSDGRD